MSTDPSARRTLLDSSGDRSLERLRLDSVRATAVQEAILTQGSVIEMHRLIAMRLLREGSPVQAFQELVRASRAVPMNPRLAANLSYLSLRARTFGPALTLLTQGLDETEDAERIGVMRQLARLARRSGDLERARESLALLLAERPFDRRARAVLNALLEREERWEELDASLEKETRAALKRGALVNAARIALRRARMWDTRLDDHARAALRYMQGGQYAEQAGDHQRALLLRLLWVRALHHSAAPPRAVDDAVALTLATGDRAGLGVRARTFIDELGLKPSEPATVEMPPPEPRRHSTQLELVAVAEAAERAGHRSEAAAVLAVAVREGPDPAAARKLEALHIQRGAWRDLAVLYKDLMGQVSTPQDRAAWAEKLAELLESEFDDVRGAARAWSVVVEATGDPRAVSEQVRLLSQRKDNSGIRAALDVGVHQAQSVAEKAAALVLRAEEAVIRKDAQPGPDFEAALALVPLHPGAAAGLAELRAAIGDFSGLELFSQALAQLPAHARGRGDLYRRLARLAETAQNQTLAENAWAQVLVEFPGDAEASGRSLRLTRERRDDGALEHQLRAAIASDPRSPKSRPARAELVEVLTRQGRRDDVLVALKDAVRAEPGYREGWLAYAAQLEAMGGREADLVVALEHAAGATPDEAARAELWRRLEQLARDHLNDSDRAATWARRADRLEKELEAAKLAEGPNAPRPSPGLPGGPLVIPPRRRDRLAVRPVVTAAPAEEVATVALELDANALMELESAFASPPRPPAPQRVESKSRPAVARSQPFESESTEVGVPETSNVPPPRPDSKSRPAVARAAPTAPDLKEPVAAEPEPQPKPRREPEGNDDRTRELSADDVELALGDASQALAPSFGPSPSKTLGAERASLFERTRNQPLDPEGYRILAEHFDTANESERSSLMLEVARAIEGDPHAAPRSPRLILDVEDRDGLRPAVLRTPEGELLTLVGRALCSLYPAQGKDGGAREEFHLESGKGAPRTAEALLAAVRVLGLPAREVHLSDDSGPPFSLVYSAGPRVLVGKLAVKRALDHAELRFFAGRALLTQLPDLMCLRSLRREQLLRGLAVITSVGRGRSEGVEGRVIRDHVPARAWERIRELTPLVATIDVARLAEGARHAANRAGLVVCGGVAPAVAALRAKKSLPTEMIELVRYASSERYLQLRSRVLGRR